jgi:hypothetical protein
MDKDKIVLSFIENLKESFIDEFDKIEQSRQLVNKYLNEIDFNFEYDYNNFCVDFLNSSEKILRTLTDEEILYLDINDLVYESFMYMIKTKIFDSAKNDSDKQKLILLHELKQFLIKKDIDEED